MEVGGSKTRGTRYHTAAGVKRGCKGAQVQSLNKEQMDSQVPFPTPPSHAFTSLPSLQRTADWGTQSAAAGSQNVGGRLAETAEFSR